MAQPVIILLCCAAIIGLSLNQIKWNEQNCDGKLFVNSSNDSDVQGQLSIEDFFRAKNCSAIRLINLANEHTEKKDFDRSETPITDASTNYQGPRKDSDHGTDDTSNQAVGGSNTSYGYEDSLQSDQPINDSSSQVKNATRDASIHETDNDTNSASRNRSSSTGWENGSYSETWEQQASNSSANQYSQESSNWTSSYGSRNVSQYQETMNESHNVPANASHQAVGGFNFSYGYEDSWQSGPLAIDPRLPVNNDTQGASIRETDNSRNSASGNRSSSSDGENGFYSENEQQRASYSSANQYLQESGDESSQYQNQDVSQFQGTINESHNQTGNASAQSVGESNSPYDYEEDWQSDQPINDSNSELNNDTQSASGRETYISGNSASGNRSSSSGGENGYYFETWKQRTSNSSANQYSQESGDWSSYNENQDDLQFQGTTNESRNRTGNASAQSAGESNSPYDYEEDWQSDQPINDSSFQINNDTQGASIRETYNNGNSASGNRSSSSGGENGYYFETWEQRTSDSSANQYPQESGDWSSSYGNQDVLQFQGTINESRNQTGTASSQSAGESNASYDYEEGWQSDQPINDSSFQINNDTQGASIRETYNSGNSASGNSSSSGGENGYYFETWEQRTSNSSANQYSQESGDWSSYNENQDVSQFQGTMNGSHNETGYASNQAIGRSNSSYGYEDSRQSHSAANNSARNGTISSYNDFSNNDQTGSDNFSSGNAGNSSSELRVQCEGEVDHLTSIKDVSRSQRLFALGLYKTIRTRGPANLAVSTANTFFSLAEISYGAVEQTRAELQFALQLPSPYCYDPLRGYEDSMARIRTFNRAGVALAHGIYLSPEYEVSSEFRRVVNSSFLSKVNRLTNRGSPAKWFTKNGNPFGMLLSRFVSAENIRGNESIILLSGAYIKGSWLNKFHRCTEKIKIDGGSSYGVSESSSMQSIGKFNYGKLPDVDASFIEMPLADNDNPGRGAIFIVLPNEAHGLDKLESGMNEDTISQQIFNGNSETVTVTLPEFIIEYHSNLVTTLRQMNLNKMFNDEADFRNITVSGPAKVELVLHKLVIHGRKTNSSPTSCASNVTADASDDATIQFKADRPFLIVVAIRDENPIIVSIARFAVANDNF